MHIVSGGQTGVDRAALDVALALGFPCGGWCPKSRLAEDGVIPSIYPLRETPSTDYAVRTQWNVRDSDGTLILLIGPPQGGTQFTIECARKHAKPFHIVNLNANVEDTVSSAIAWLQHNRIATLNIAGPRESEHPGIYQLAYNWLQLFFQKLSLSPPQPPCS